MTLDLSAEGIARASSRRPWRTVGLWIALVKSRPLLSTATLLEDALTTEFG